MVRYSPILVAGIALLAGCGPGPERSTDPSSAAPGTVREAAPQRVQDSRRPEITIERISKDVVGWAVEVAEATGSGPTDKWTFEASEYRRIDILEKHATDSGEELLVFMLSRDNPKAGEPALQVSGRLKLRYDWRDGRWVLRRIENLTFRYTVGVAT
jgi:hypothetical protein